MRGCLTPLNTTFGGSFPPLAFTASTTVKLCLSAPQVVIGTVRLPVNSGIRVAGSSNRIGVSSLFRMWLGSYPQRLRALTTNLWNSMTFSSMSVRRRCASVVLFLVEMAWRHFQLVYQPSAALKVGSVLSSLAFTRGIMLLTDRPAKEIQKISNAISAQRVKIKTVTQ